MGCVRYDKHQILTPKKGEKDVHEKNQGKRHGEKGPRHEKYILSFLHKRLVVLDISFSPTYLYLDKDVSSSLCPKVGQNFYISIVEIWYMDFSKKKEERVLLMISSVEIKILLHLLVL